MATADLLQVLEGYSLAVIAKNGNKTTPSKATLIAVVDNSSSMTPSRSVGNVTKKCVEGIVLPLSQSLSLNTIKLVLFSRDVVIQNIENNKMLADISYPPQECTNITKGILTAIDDIVRNSNKEIDAHYVLVFLSDGQHNEGDKLTYEMCVKKKNLLTEKNIKLSIVIVGIDSSDTSLGMLIKSMETVSLDIDSLFYIQNHSVEELLSQVTNAVAAVVGNEAVVMDVSVYNGSFDNSKLTTVSLHLDNETCKVLLIKGDFVDIQLRYNGVLVEIARNDSPHINDIVLYFKEYLRVQMLELSRQKVAGIDIVYKVDYLKEVTNLLLTQIKLMKTNLSNNNNVNNNNNDNNSNNNNVNNNNNNNNNNENENVISAKELTKNITDVEIIKNIFNDLMARIDNNSQSQAAFLTGINGKFAGKALKRKRNNQFDVYSVIKAMVASDLLSTLSNLIVTSQNKDLVHKEMVYKWINFLIGNSTIAKESKGLNMYELLKKLPFVGLKTAYELCDGTQMNPFLMNVTLNDKNIINSTTYYAESESKTNLETGFLPLLSLSYPEASLALMKTDIYRQLCSVEICKGLGLWHGYMPFAMYTHSCAAAVSTAVNNIDLEYIKIALHIAYTLQKYVGALSDVDTMLFSQWWNEYKRPSAKNGCNHPKQLLMLYMLQPKMSANQFDKYTIPLRSLLVEVYYQHFLHMKKQLKITVDALLQQLFGVTNDNIPLISDTQDKDTVKQLCLDNVDIHISALERNLQKPLSAIGMQQPFLEHLESIAKEYYIFFWFVYSFQKYIVKTTSWQQLIIEIENCGSVPPNIANVLFEDIKLVSSHWQRIKCQLVPNCSSSLELVVIFANSLLLDNSEPKPFLSLPLLIQYLKFQKYEELCELKKSNMHLFELESKCNILINGSVQEYADLCGSHVHGHCKKLYKGLLEGALLNPLKLTLFLEKSNSLIKDPAQFLQKQKEKKKKRNAAKKAKRLTK